MIGLFLIAIAAQADPDFSNLRSVANLNGTCERLVVADVELTHGCIGRLVNTAYSTGRGGFTFTLIGDAAVVTFTGIDSAAVGDRAEILIDRVLWTRLGQDPQEIRVSGRCVYTNPYAGVATVRCSSRGISGGNFEGSFRTNGREPHLLEF